MAILDDTRADWNARPPLRTRTTVPWADRVGVSWHWIGPGKGPAATGPHSACLEQVRKWQAQHQANGWKDIGYNALVCQHGRAIEGRGLEFSGSHSPGVNTEHVGIQFMVGDASGPITPVMVARAQRLRFDIGRLGKNIRRDWGHRDDPKASTACPGNAIYAWVHSGAPTKYAPPAPTPTTEEFVMATRAELIAALTSPEVTEVLAREIVTGTAICKNPANPTGPRVSLSAVVELAAAQAIQAAAAAGSISLTKEEAKAAFDEALAGLTVTGTLGKAGA